jgi:sulfatase maturation enzyme AslB (radical SAM superfamily)
VCSSDLPKNHLVLFGIDGLADTHSLYRIGTDFDMIIRNAQAFIAAGGKARWNFITFQHNEHQLEQCRQLAKELGFESFHEKQTSRFIGSKQFNVFDRGGKITHTLLPPGEQKIAFIDRKTVENYREVIKTATISCQIEDERSIYVDAQGHLWPCCFLASVPYQYATPDKLVYNFMNDSTASLLAAITVFGGMDGLDLRTHTIEEIVDSHAWQTMWNERFEDKSILMCARVCGKFPEVEVSQCRDQFLELREFNE